MGVFWKSPFNNMDHTLSTDPLASLGPDCGVNVTSLPYGATSNCTLGTHYTEGPCLVKCFDGFQYNATNYTCSIAGNWTGDILCIRTCGCLRGCGMVWYSMFSFYNYVIDVYDICLFRPY